MKKTKNIFLDRDGVINKKRDGDYVKTWGEFEFLPDAIEAMHILTKKGYRIFIFTNQRGIARGLMAAADLERIHNCMQKELSEHDIAIHGIYHCPHGDDDQCPCRKPKPGMLLAASKDHGIDLSEAIVIGDSASDIEAGRAVGCTTILISRENNLLSAVKNLA